MSILFDHRRLWSNLYGMPENDLKPNHDPTSDVELLIQVAPLNNGAAPINILLNRNHGRNWADVIISVSLLLLVPVVYILLWHTPHDAKLFFVFWYRVCVQVVGLLTLITVETIIMFVKLPLLALSLSALFIKTAIMPLVCAITPFSWCSWISGVTEITCELAFDTSWRQSRLYMIELVKGFFSKS